MVRKMLDAPPDMTLHKTHEVNPATGEFRVRVIPAEVITPDEVARRVRVRRDGLLADCDWVVIRGAERGAQPMAQAWAAYRQALRDITTQPGFPDSVTWPTPPA
jgi:hypothetical protein